MLIDHEASSLKELVDRKSNQPTTYNVDFLRLHTMIAGSERIGERHMGERQEIWKQGQFKNYDKLKYYREPCKCPLNHGLKFDSKSDSLEGES